MQKMQPIATFSDQLGPNSIGVKHLGLNENDLSGDYIDGGTITNFNSTGIQDLATKNMVIVRDTGTVVASGLKVVDGNNDPILEIDALGVRIKRTLAVDNFIETKRSTSPVLELAFENGGLGSGLITKDQLNHQSLLYKDNAWHLSDSLKLPGKAVISIGNTPTLTADTLGGSVIKSNLRKLGLLDELRVRGDLIVNEAFYYNATSNRLGINTLDPSGVLSVHENGVEVSIRGEDYLRAKIGTVTKHDLHLMVNDQTAVSIDIDGKVVIGADSRSNAKLTVNHNVDSDYAATLTNTGMGLAISAGSNSKLVVTNKQTKAVEFIVDDNKVGIGVAKPEANLHVAGDVKLMGKHMSSAPGIPSSGNHYQGDIVWNSNPGPTQYIGWVCVKDGVPGVWAGFGRIDDIS